MASAMAKVQSAACTSDQGGVRVAGLDGETQVVFVIGDPIAQVKSPSLLTRRFAARGVNTVVVPGHVSPKDIPVFMAGLQSLRNAPGLVITVPHKQAMMDYCAEVTERARYAGAANVLRRREGGWIGDNTDGMGYVNGIRAEGCAIEGKRVLLVGAGGAGSAIAYEFLLQGVAHLAVHDVDAGRRDGLIARLETPFAGRLSVGTEDPTGFDVIANATPLGMRDGDPMPVLVDRLHAGQFAACPITKPEASPFIVAARSKGCTTMAGLGMFKAQEALLVDALLHLGN